MYTPGKVKIMKIMQTLSDYDQQKEATREAFSHSYIVTPPLAWSKSIRVLSEKNGFICSKQSRAALHFHPFLADDEQSNWNASIFNKSFFLPDFFLFP